MPLFLMMLGCSAFWRQLRLQIVFRTSWLKAALIVILTGAVLFPAFFFCNQFSA